MAKENKPKKIEPRDEIDLGQLFALIGRGFQKMFVGLLRVFLYFKKNIVILSVLVIVGVLAGFGLRSILGEEQKLDIIVTPNIGSKNYLYDVIDEIQSDIKSKDTAFFTSMGMDMDKMSGFKIEINPLKAQSGSGLEDEMKFLELLKDFGNSDAISDILRSELLDKTTNDQRITFYFDDPNIGEAYAQKIISYINSNAYYNDLLKVYTENARERIQRNDSLIRQIDVLIDNYTQKMLREQATTEGRLVLENQEPLDIPSLFTLKNRLIQDIESKKLELLERRDQAITVVSFGKPYTVQKPLLKKQIALVPLSLLGIFFLISLIKYLNRKSKEMGIE